MERKNYDNILATAEKEIKEHQNLLIKVFKDKLGLKKYMKTNTKLDEFFHSLDDQKDSSRLYLSYLKVCLTLLDESDKEMKLKLSQIKTWDDMKKYLDEEVK